MLCYLSITILLCSTVSRGGAFKMIRQMCSLALLTLTCTFMEKEGWELEPCLCWLPKTLLFLAAFPLSLPISVVFLCCWSLPVDLNRLVRELKLANECFRKISEAGNAKHSSKSSEKAKTLRERRVFCAVSLSSERSTAPLWTPWKTHTHRVSWKKQNKTKQNLEHAESLCCFGSESLPSTEQEHTHQLTTHLQWQRTQTQR